VKWSPSEHFDVMLWIKNSLNAQYWNQGNPTGFGPTGYPAPPRTFGITGEWHLK
jgi:outer membrane receptor protein involved in Fe transport